MRLALLTALTMTAFAANSLLNRMAVESGEISPELFAALRVASGALMLTVLARFQGRDLALFSRSRLFGALALATYMIGFSLAYRVLDAGVGALVLFGVVQIAMFGWTAIRGAPARPRQVLGAAVASAGLAWVVWPSAETVVDPVGALWMALAGVAWAAYTLIGRTSTDALAATAGSFCVALVPVGLVAAARGVGMAGGFGVALAVLSGAVTSGLGYALWYRLLPQLNTGLAATVQVSVPIIALAASVALLGETATPALIMGSVLVLGGIVLALRR